MLKNAIIILFLMVAIALVMGCAASNAPKNITATASGERMLGLDMTLPADNNFTNAYEMAKATGISFVQITPGWDDIEPSPGQYNDPQGQMDSARAFYSHENLKIALAVSPLDTNVDRMPADLKGRPFDDPTVVDRYDRMIDSVLKKYNGLSLLDLSIGNEVDVYLGSNETRWDQYDDLFNQVRDHVKAEYPDLKVGVKATFNGLVNGDTEQLKKLNENSDVILVTYYPLNPDFTVKDPSVVKDDFNRICSLYPGKDIYFLEIGYPSSTTLNSSEEKQAEFIRDTFAAWDEHKTQIKVLNFVYMHDVSQLQLDTMTGYYGLSDKNFIAYLGSLGLRTSDGNDKMAWTAFKEEALARGL